MLVFLLSLAVLSVHGQNDNHQDETLRKQVEILTESVEKMQAMIQGISVQGENADHQYEALRKKFDLQTENMEQMQAKDAALEHDIQELNRSRLMEPVICFSAVKTSIQEASAGDDILFDVELIDTHDTYNPTYGVYVIPQDGVYEVIVTLYKGGGSSYNGAYGDLYVGDTFLTAIYNHVDSGTTASFHSTMSIIQEFRAGNVLHVVSYFDISFYGDSNRRSQFSAKYLGPAPSA